MYRCYKIVGLYHIKYICRKLYYFLSFRKNPETMNPIKQSSSHILLWYYTNNHLNMRSTISIMLLMNHTENEFDPVIQAQAMMKYKNTSSFIRELRFCIKKRYERLSILSGSIIVFVCWMIWICTFFILDRK